MVFAVAVCGVDAGLAQRSVNCLLDLLFLGLLDGHLALLLDNLCRAVGCGNGDRIHRNDLHRDTLCQRSVNRLVEGDDSAELAVDGVDVGCDEGSLELRIVCEAVLFATLSGLLGDSFFNGLAVSHLAALQCLDVSGEALDGGVGNRVGECLELSVLRDEVGLATKADEDRLAAVDTGEDGTFGGLAVRTLGSDELAFLTNDFLCAGEIAFGLYEGLLAIHHAGTGHFAQFCDINSFDFHNSWG